MKLKSALVFASVIALNAGYVLAAPQNFYTPDTQPKKLAEARDADADLTNPAGATIYAPNARDHVLAGTPPPTTANTSTPAAANKPDINTKNFIKAGTPDGPASVSTDPGNNHSTGASAVVRSSVGVPDTETGVSSGVRN